ncbi:hypothetical protein OC861_006246 [Tilletia horrida]|nr:hypothetical protein OC861_006246 [Tilletia horrida]
MASLHQGGSNGLGGGEGSHSASQSQRRGGRGGGGGGSRRGAAGSASSRGGRAFQSRGGAGSQHRQKPSITQTPDASTPPSSAPTPPLQPTVSTHLSTVRFDSLGGRIDQRLLDAIAFPLLSEVQAATLEPALSGNDVLAQAKTGTGKTIAFLLPTLSRLLSQTPQNSSRFPVSGSVSCLILSPTRELALQIEREAEMLLKNVSSDVLGVQHVVGGTNMKAEERNLATKRCDVLVATPGRLLDHLNNTQGMAHKFGGLQVVVLDEADRMLDMGFRQELDKINAFLPNRHQVPRQALLFSATIPPGVREVADLSPDAHFVNTLSEEEVNTHAHVPQQSIISAPERGMQDLLPLTLALLVEELRRAPTSAKVIVFSPTARAAGLCAEVFRSRAVRAFLSQVYGEQGSAFSIGEVHSRRSQAARTAATAEFGAAHRGVLFSSDVAARGVDFPGVTAVIQVGLPASPEQYIHRIGRTGRAGATGRGVIVLADFESYFLGNPEMRELPISSRPASDGGADFPLEQARAIIAQALREEVGDDTKAQTYQAMLGYYKSELRKLKWNAATLVQRMNEYADQALLYNGGAAGGPAPPLLAKTVGKMGLKGTPGLNVVHQLPDKAGGGGGGRGNANGAGASQHRRGFSQSGHGSSGSGPGGGGPSHKRPRPAGRPPAAQQQN